METALALAAMPEKLPMLEPRQRDRLESLKAGLLATSALIPTALLLVGVSGLSLQWLDIPAKAAALLRPPPFDVERAGAWLPVTFHWGATALTAFLFGVTYRYAIRQDNNPQLRLGTVLAFALARGLGQAEVGWWLSRDGLWLGWVLESVGMFAIAALLLNVALQQGWITPAPAQEHTLDTTPSPEPSPDPPDPNQA